MIDVGDRAPDFSLPDQHGRQVSLTDFRGGPVVVYFYPKDHTPGCTTQACGVRDHWSALQAAGAAVVGISPDGVDSHASFAEEFDLPFSLLSDPDKQVIERYGAWGEKIVRGEQKVGVLRSTFLVDADGMVGQIWPNVDPTTHAGELLSALEGHEQG